MPYNNYYPATYQSPIGFPQYQQSAMSQMQMPQMSMAAQPQSSSGLTWVQGEVGAKAYPVEPGKSVLLMDSDDARFYIKSADASGMPMPLRVFSYTEEVATQHSHDNAPQINTADFVTREEFEEWKNQQRGGNFKKEKSNGEQRV